MLYIFWFALLFSFYRRFSPIHNNAFQLYFLLKESVAFLLCLRYFIIPQTGLILMLRTCNLGLVSSFS
jgi:hypothetical protein